jgi:hypothetical protein
VLSRPGDGFDSKVGLSLLVALAEVGQFSAVVQFSLEMLQSLSQKPKPLKYYYCKLKANRALKLDFGCLVGEGFLDFKGG